MIIISNLREMYFSMDIVVICSFTTAYYISVLISVLTLSFVLKVRG